VSCVFEFCLVLVDVSKLGFLPAVVSGIGACFSQYISTILQLPLFVASTLLPCLMLFRLYLYSGAFYGDLARVFEATMYVSFSIIHILYPV
jgi:hypothetical protein